MVHLSLHVVDPRFPEIPRYLSIERHATAVVAPNLVLVLDCLPFAVRSHSARLNVSSLQWKFGFEEEGEVINEDNPLRRVHISDDGFRLTINRTTLKTGADLGTDGLYTCRSCNRDAECLSRTTAVTIFGKLALQYESEMHQSKLTCSAVIQHSLPKGT